MKTLHDLHNDGQEHRSEGKGMDLPNPIIQQTIFNALGLEYLGLAKTSEQADKENKAYESGYKHTNDQINE